MKVFKFGGASVKSAEAVKNVAKIIKSYTVSGEELFVVISAMGKSTNLLEKIVFDESGNNEKEKDIKQFIDYHIHIDFSGGFTENCS